MGTSSARVAVEATIYGAAVAWLYAAGIQMHMQEDKKMLMEAFKGMTLLLGTSTYATMYSRVFLPAKITSRTRSENDAGILVGVMLLPLVLTARLVVQYSQQKIMDEYTLTALYMSIGLGITSLVRVFTKFPNMLISLFLDLVVGLGLLRVIPDSLDLQFSHIVFVFFLYYIILTFGIIALPRSFTLGEAIIVAQGCTFAAADSILFTLQKMNIVTLGIIPEHDATSIMIQLILLCGLLLCVILTPLFRQYGTSSPRRSPSPLPLVPTLLFLAYVGAVGGVFLIWSWFLLEVPVWLWLFNKIMQPTATYVIIFWLIMLAVIVPLCPVISKSLNLSQIISRKLYHFLAVAMFLPASYWDMDLLRLSYAIAVGVFMVIECIRALGVPPFGVPISNFVSKYLDRRDEGRVILTHTYLLLGCALPAWLNPSSNSMLTANAGVLALGIGDAMGAIVGSKMGQIKVCGKKTLEGSIAVFISMAAFGLLTVQSLNELKRGTSYSSVALLAFIASAWFTSALEAVTCQIDNLVLPLFYYSLCCITEIYTKF